MREESMSQRINIYCDESCHLEHDGQNVMVLGAIWHPAEKAREIAVRLREIKAIHSMAKDFEVKWVKVSPAKLSLYYELINYFFDDDDLHFRAIIVADKDKLNHQRFHQDHDTWYYKMYFEMLTLLLDPVSRYRIYIDIKDTHSSKKQSKLHDVLCCNMYDFRRSIIERIQPVRSHQVEQVQLADLLVGAVSYANRGLSTSPAKAFLVERIRQKTGYSLTKSTLLREQKCEWQRSKS